MKIKSSVKSIAIASIFLGGLIFTVTNCTKKPDDVPVVTPASLQLPVTTNRLSTTQFEVIIDASTLNGFSTSALAITISNATATAFTNTSGNLYVSTVTALNPSGEVPITMTWSNYTKSITALIFPSIDATWDQPEAVPGFVNTDGWEDSPEISPDGLYLAVSTYSPVSLFQCIMDGVLASAPSCNANSYTALLTQRPNFPGASRILSPTLINHSPNILNPPNTTSAFPPVSSYVFTKQSDGSFKGPIAVYVDWDAYTWGAPFGFHFRRKISDGVYYAYGAFGDPTLGTGNKLQSFTLNLTGSTVVLGTVSLVGGVQTKSNWAMTPLSIPGLASETGNPGSSVYGPTGDGYLFWDNESIASGTRDIYFATETAAGTFGAKQTAGVSLGAFATTDEYQPFFYQNRLYFGLLHAALYSSQLTTAANPALAGSWSAPRMEIATDSSHTHAGRFNAMGEPSLYLDSSGKTWMYFAYAVAGSANLNLNIGRVRAK